MMERPVEMILDAGDLAFAARCTEVLSSVVQELFPAVSNHMQIVLRDIGNFLREGNTGLAWEWWLMVTSYIRANMIHAGAYTHEFVN